MKKTNKNFSFSEFMSFSESLVDSLDAVASKIEEVTSKIDNLEQTLGTSDADVSAEENVDADANVEEPAEEGADTGTEEVVSEEVTAEEVPEEGAGEEAVEITEEPVPPESSEQTEEETDQAAIDAMETGDENFSNKFMVVGLKNRPWGNRVISEKEFSEKEHRKLIPTLFSTREQAQRAMTSYNVNGENFSTRYNHVKGLLNL